MTRSVLIYCAVTAALAYVPAFCQQRSTQATTAPPSESAFTLPPSCNIATLQFGSSLADGMQRENRRYSACQKDIEKLRVDTRAQFDKTVTMCDSSGCNAQARTSLDKTMKQIQLLDIDARANHEKANLDIAKHWA